MKANYDPEVDALTIPWSNTSIEESDEVEPGIILAYNKNGNVVGIEVLNASREIAQLSSALSYSMHSSP